VSHANAALTPVQRLRVARLIVDDGWPIVRAAEQFNVSWPTAKRWAARYAAMGKDGLHDRSSRPHRSPNRTPAAVVRRIVHLRWKTRLGPVQIATRLGVPASTVHAVLVRCRLNRLSHVDKRTGEVVRRYEHEYPGAMIHVDVKKLGNIPDGGGWRFVGRQQGDWNRIATPGKPKNRHHNPKMGHAFVHTVIDDNSRVAYAEIHDDETAATAVGVLRRAVSWFAVRGVRVERVLSDNGSAYVSFAWRDACAELNIKPKRTRPRRPQTNGKIERFHRTMGAEWAFVRHYGSESARRNALPAWLHHYNHHRLHTAIGKATPTSRLTNLPGQYI
jgi:transposase InsO family protein